MRHRDGAGLLRVVDEIALGPAPGLGDDLDGILVRTHRAVGAQAVEHGAYRVLRLEVERVVHLKRQPRHIVHDTHREVRPRRGRRELVENGFDHRRREFLGAQTVAAADHPRHRAHRGDGPGHAFGQRGHDVLIQGLADRARFLGAIQHGNALYGGGQHAEKVEDAPGPVQLHRDHAEFCIVESVHRDARRF
jgi:hypothetical protein